jgi:hypothetical protein
MKFRPSIPELRWVWIGGCLYATLFVLVGLLKWEFSGAFGVAGFLGYVLAAIAVLVFSRGVYNRSLVSGVLLLGTALGPTVSGFIRWGLEDHPIEAAVFGGLDAVILLAGLGLGALVFWGLYRLRTATLRSREGASP